jgi:aryl-alcohol dehydrogenase-like predicted oxidoreductase
VNIVVNAILMTEIPLGKHRKAGRNVSIGPSPPTEIILGTVQIGMQYGVNSTAMDETGAERILDAAWDAGLRTIDTARAYGAAESRIGGWMRRRGRQFRIVTKVPRHRSATADKADWIAEQFSASLMAMGVDHVDALLAHHPDDFLSPAGHAAFQRMRESGRTARIGVSVYDSDTAAAALAAGATALQIPASIADWRHQSLLQNDHAGRLMVRSVFLQGVLLMPPARLPSWLAPLRDFVATIATISNSLETTPTSIALRAARDGLGVRLFVLGFDSPNQIVAALQALQEPPLPAEVLEQLRLLAIALPLDAIDPRRWPKDN